MVCRPPAQGHVPGHNPASAHLTKDQWWHSAGLEQGGLLPDGGGGGAGPDPARGRPPRDQAGLPAHGQRTKPHTAGSPLGTCTPDLAPPWHPGRAPHPFPSTCPVSAEPGGPGLPRGQRRSGLWEKGLGATGVRRHGLTQGRGGAWAWGGGTPPAGGCIPPGAPRARDPQHRAGTPGMPRVSGVAAAVCARCSHPPPCFPISAPPPPPPPRQTPSGKEQPGVVPTSSPYPCPVPPSAAQFQPGHPKEQHQDWGELGPLGVPQIGGGTGGAPATG